MLRKLPSVSSLAEPSAIRFKLFFLLVGNERKLLTLPLITLPVEVVPSPARAQRASKPPHNPKIILPLIHHRIDDDRLLILIYLIKYQVLL